jgi:hypothetical protein
VFLSIRKAGKAGKENHEKVGPDQRNYENPDKK